MNFHATLAQDAVFLVSFWKALLIAPPFAAWAWLISSKLDKDAKHYHLNFRAWNGLHLGVGVLALAALLLIPIFFIGWLVQVILLASTICVYWYFRNQAVPETHRFYLTGQGISQAMQERKVRRASRDALFRFADSKGKELPVPLKDDPRLPIHVLAEDLLGPALGSRASKIEVLIAASGANVLFTIDGVKYKRQTLPTDAATALLDYLKGIAGLDLQDRRRRQSGKFELRREGESVIVIDLTTWGSANAIHVVIEFDRHTRLIKPFDGLGLLQSQLEGLRELEPEHERHGIILLAAPPGHGLSTCSYSFLNRHDAYTTNIKTLERDILVRLDGVDQVRWDPNGPTDYATSLQSILRRDPDIVMTGEIQDAETAKVASAPGPTGPLIYVPQRAASVAEQINIWANLVGEIRQATRGLRAVVNQRLLRSLCPNCRQAFTPTAEQLRTLNLQSAKVKQFYRASGKVQVKNKIESCPVCGGTGYLGQVGVFEVFMLDDEARRLLAARDLKGALAHARRNKMILLTEAALSKVLSGETSIEEVMRVISGSKPKPPSAAAPAARPDPAATPS